MFRVLLAGSMLLFASAGNATANDFTKEEITPINLEEFEFMSPRHAWYGQTGRVVLQFDIDETGRPQNIKVLNTKGLRVYARAAENNLEKFRFPAGRYRTGVVREINFCVRTDHRSPLYCEIRFERLAPDGTSLSWNISQGGVPPTYSFDYSTAHPRITNYTLPAYAEQAHKMGICGTVDVAFEVSKRGRPKNIEIVASNPENYFSLSVKKAISQFMFARSDEAQEMRYRISFGLPGKCEAP